MPVMESSKSSWKILVKPLLQLPVSDSSAALLPAAALYSCCCPVNLDTTSPCTHGEALGWKSSLDWTSHGWWSCWLSSRLHWGSRSGLGEPHCVKSPSLLPMDACTLAAVPEERLWAMTLGSWLPADRFTHRPGLIVVSCWCPRCPNH
jgi:hypothetical protein